MSPTGDCVVIGKGYARRGMAPRQRRSHGGAPHKFLDSRIDAALRVSPWWGLPQLLLLKRNCVTGPLPRPPAAACYKRCSKSHGACSRRPKM